MFPFTRYAALTLDRPRWTTKRRAISDAMMFSDSTGSDVEVMGRSRRGYFHAYTVHAN